MLKRGDVVIKVKGLCAPYIGVIDINDRSWVPQGHVSGTVVWVPIGSAKIIGEKFADFSILYKTVSGMSKVEYLMLTGMEKPDVT